eukprot:TRINITY_DN4053_c0_g1_i1.p1 TRINITY_DN4053_c0_g1~~TRINITY_DN4053_c0_g1_i1.p1  ORF type:complete len:125 (-),score=21.20 TRINITY_DN4053_c0_g1_i1:229-603(-)
MATTYILPRLVGMPKAIELIFTGDLVSGAKAAELGLANYAVPGEGVLERAMAIADRVAANAPLAVRWSKTSLSLVQHTAFDPKPAAVMEAHMQSRSLETDEMQEGVKALLSKREAVLILVDGDG